MLNYGRLQLMKVALTQGSKKHCELGPSVQVYLSRASALGDIHDAEPEIPRRTGTGSYDIRS